MPGQCVQPQGVAIYGRVLKSPERRADSGERIEATSRLKPWVPGRLSS